MKNPSVSIFFPCYNDQASISKLVIDAFETVKQLTNSYEVIVVDDFSKDDSVKVLKELTKKYPKLKLIIHQKNQGYGGALRSGFKASTKNLICYTDGDKQYDIKELPILLSLMNEKIDFVNGIKAVRRDPTYRVFIGNFYSFVTRWLFWIPIYDIDCDFRLIRKSIIKKIDLHCNSGAICIELVKKSQIHKARFAQVTVHHFERHSGSSQFFQPKRLGQTFLELISLWFELIVLKINT